MLVHPGDMFTNTYCGKASYLGSLFPYRRHVHKHLLWKGLISWFFISIQATCSQTLIVERPHILVLYFHTGDMFTNTYCGKASYLGSLFPSRRHGHKHLLWKGLIPWFFSSELRWFSKDPSHTLPSGLAREWD